MTLFVLCFLGLLSADLKNASYYKVLRASPLTRKSKPPAMTAKVSKILSSQVETRKENCCGHMDLSGFVDDFEADKNPFSTPEEEKV